MTTILRLVLGGAAVAGLAWGLLRAADLGAPRSTGRVLVLENERTLEGDVERDGDDYHVRRAIGELVVPGRQVLRLCADWPEAYAFLRSRANLRDADERLRLARWCQLHGLTKEALAEATAAVEIHPYSAEARGLQSVLKRAVATAQSRAAPAPAVAPTGPPVPSLPPVDLDTESVSLFTTRVQPILMNVCASCHANDRGGSYRLLRTYSGSGLGQRATQYNLSATVAQINLQRPHLSPLLIKAVSRHGPAGQAPLKSRQTPAFRNLQEWVEVTLANNPHLVEEAAPPAAPPAGAAPHPMPPPAAPEEVGAFTPAAPASPPGAPVVGMSGAAPPVVTTPGPPAVNPPAADAPAAPRKLPQPAAPLSAGPVDVVDPDVYNRQVHPEKWAAIHQ